MGDIARHRDIYLFTREAVPTQLLERNRLTAADLTFLELGNYLTDVSQFRDPVTYIFAKQRVWRDFIIPQTADKTQMVRGLGALALVAGIAAKQYLSDLIAAVPRDVSNYGGVGLAAVGGIIAALPNDTYAEIKGADDWIDALLGTPLERTPGDPKRREDKHYGFLGGFFRHFIEGITHVLFAQDIKTRVQGGWGQIDRVQESRVTEVFTEFFTQYWPHEHTDQPPYVWDASERPSRPNMYGPSRRQRTLQEPDIGIMNAVDVHYVRYLAEGLTELEQQWRALKPADQEGRQKMLVRMGKLLHGIEDWYFHSNVVEILAARGHKTPQGASESDEAFLKRFVEETAATVPEFKDAKDTPQLQLERKLFRRLRFPAYERGTKIESGGVLSTAAPSTPSLRHAYPAFPSQADTTKTLLHGLETLEHKLTHPDLAGRDRHLSEVLAEGLPDWLMCVSRKFFDARNGDGRKLLNEKAAARGVNPQTVALGLVFDGPQRAVIVDVLREWIPFVLTLLDESERQRLVADVAAEAWPPPTGTAPKPKPDPNSKAPTQLDHQLELHQQALEPKPSDDGLVENNYERAARYLTDCGFLNERGRQAIVKAFEIDRTAQKLLDGAPGCGGFLMRLAIELQEKLDAGDKATAVLNKDKQSHLGTKSDNGAFNEIVGSHSLMSKDTPTSTPFFDETRVLASVASSSVMTIMLEQVSTPATDRRLVWTDVLHHFIRYPPRSGGWERRAIAFFRQPEGKIPTFADLPELARLVESARRPPAPPVAAGRQSKREEMEERYITLESELSKYRYQ